MKLPEDDDAPISIVGITWRTTSASPMPPAGSVPLPAFALGCRPGVGHLVVAQLARHVAGQQALPVHKPELPRCLLLRESLTHHGVADLIGDANTRGSSAQNDDTLVAERRFRRPGPRRSPPPG